MAVGDKKKSVMQFDIDTASLSNDATHVPSSPVVKSALDNYQEINTLAYMTSADIASIENAFKSAGQYTFIYITSQANQGGCVMGQKRTNTDLFKGFFTAPRGVYYYVGIATRTPDANGDGTWTFVNFI